MEISLSSKVNKDNYVEYVSEKFDLSIDDYITTFVPIFDKEELNDFEWNIGLILGNSGSGKSTILSRISKIEDFKYDYEKSIVSQYDWLSEEEVSSLLYGIGLASIPVWIHKPNELSNGERARLDIVSKIACSLRDGGIIAVDEFTSVVNRETAKAMSFALQRYVREHNLKIILASCHYDIIDWLNPDWIFNLNKKTKGYCELEHINYKGNKYKSYKSISNKEILSDARSVL